MPTNIIVDFIQSWKEAIVKAYTEHPVAGAIVIVLCISLFIILNKKNDRIIENLLISLAVFLVVSPLLGFIMKVLGELWMILKKLASMLEELYRIYADKPILILALLGLHFIAFFVLKPLWPNRFTSKRKRILWLLISFIVLSFLAYPIAKL